VLIQYTMGIAAAANIAILNWQLGLGTGMGYTNLTPSQYSCTKF
jgi:hypothetical protein